MFAASLLASALLCSVVSTTPVVVNNAPITLSLSRRLNLTGTGNLLLHDQARAKSLLARVGAGTDSNKISLPNLEIEPLDNQVVTYIAAIGVGTPPTTCQYFDTYNAEAYRMSLSDELILDTGR
jgi:cathepsin E